MLRLGVSWGIGLHRMSVRWVLHGRLEALSTADSGHYGRSRLGFGGYASRSHQRDQGGPALMADDVIGTFMYISVHVRAALCMFDHIFASRCISVQLCISLYNCTTLHISVDPCTTLYLSVNMCTTLCVSVHICTQLYASVHLSICASLRIVAIAIGLIPESFPIMTWQFVKRSPHRSPDARRCARPATPSMSKKPHTHTSGSPPTPDGPEAPGADPPTVPDGKQPCGAAASRRSSRMRFAYSRCLASSVFNIACTHHVYLSV